MTEPAAKRVCSAVTGVLRRIAVEGNIGEHAVAFRKVMLASAIT